MRASTGACVRDNFPAVFGMRGSRLVCASCGAENKESAKFCNECGAAMALGCPGCATPYRSGQKFCEECGFALTAAPASEASGGVAAAVPGLRFGWGFL